MPAYLFIKYSEMEELKNGCQRTPVKQYNSSERCLLFAFFHDMLPNRVLKNFQQRVGAQGKYSPNSTDDS